MVKAQRKTTEKTLYKQNLVWMLCARLVTSLCSHFNKLSVKFKSRLLSLSVFDAYEKITELSIEDSIKNELSGDFERLMLAVGKRLGESATHRKLSV